MSKTVYRNAKIVLGGIDVSNSVKRWAIGAEVGQLYIAEIDIVDNPDTIRITADGRRYNANRVAVNDKIVVVGRGGETADISRWIGAYGRFSAVGRVDVVRLHVQCDTEVLEINGTHPWEEERVSA